MGKKNLNQKKYQYHKGIPIPRIYHSKARGKKIMKKKAKFDWNDVVKLVVVLKNGRRVTLEEKAVKGIVRALYIAAIHRF